MDNVPQVCIGRCSRCKGIPILARNIADASGHRAAVKYQCFPLSFQLHIGTHGQLRHTFFIRKVHQHICIFAQAVL